MTTRHTPQTDSWWTAPLTREQFSREVATRYALNKAEKDSQGIGAWAKQPKNEERRAGESRDRSTVRATAATFGGRAQQRLLGTREE